MCIYPPLEAARANDAEYVPQCVGDQRTTRITSCSHADTNAETDSIQERCGSNCQGCYSEDGYICKKEVIVVHVLMMYSV